MLKSGPFQLPLNPGQFAAALQKGQGRALLHVRTAGMAGLERVILDSCLYDRSYDPQCEGTRSDWLMEIIDAGGAESLVANALLAQGESLPARYWDSTHRCRIIRELAQRGHPEARSRLYDSLQKWPDSADVIGAEDIIAIDGADGLLHVAEYLGMLLQKEPGFWADDNLLRWFDESHGSGAARRVLEAAVVHSPPIAEYLRHLAQHDQARLTTSGDVAQRNAVLDLNNIQLDRLKAKSHVERIRSISAAKVVQEIETTDPQHNRYWFTSWGLRAPVEELAVVFDAMILQSDPGRLCKYLRVFGRRALPCCVSRHSTLSRASSRHLAPSACPA